MIRMAKERRQSGDATNGAHATDDRLLGSRRPPADDSPVDGFRAQTHLAMRARITAKCRALGWRRPDVAVPRSKGVNHDELGGSSASASSTPPCCIAFQP
jgi:hypothetical protein